MNGCKCFNNEDIPVPKISKVSTLNSTLEVDWLILLNDIYSKDGLANLTFFVKNVSNPTLPWGGNKHDIADVEIPLQLYAKENDHIAGSSAIHVGLLIQGVSYEIQSRVIDEHGCVGGSVISAFRVENGSSMFLYIKIAIPVVCLLVMCLVLFLKFTRKDDSKKDDL